MGFRRSSGNTRPYFTKARFPSTCPETGKAISKGDDIAYFPATKQAFHSESQSAETVRGMNFAESHCMADAQY